MADELKSTGIYSVSYDGTNFVLHNKKIPTTVADPFAYNMTGTPVVAYHGQYSDDILNIAFNGNTALSL